MQFLRSFYGKNLWRNIRWDAKLSERVWCGGSFFIYTALAPFAMELALVYLQLEEDEKNGFADTADYEHLKKLCHMQ